MDDRKTLDTDRARKGRSQDPSAASRSALIRRLWMFMVLLAVPFLFLSYHYCEALERTGPVGAFCAAPLLSAAVLAYAGFIVMLKKRNS